MSEPRRDSDYLADIIESINRILDYSRDLSWNSFLDDIKTQDAIIRNLEVMGEATKRLSTEFRDVTPQIPWKDMMAVRDRLIHHYFGINNEILWEIIQADLPEILPELVKLDLSSFS